ncbi:MAG: hypothetical protein RL375_3127, partial [Pseudomonadota bacterium]
MSHTDGARGNELQQLRARLADAESSASALPGRFIQPKIRAMYRHITQANHGFAIGDVVNHDGIDWTAANGITIPGSIVAAVPTPHTFVIALPGSCVRLPGLLTAGTTYSVSGGAIQPYDWVLHPAGQLILHAISADEGIVLSDRATDLQSQEGIVGIYELPAAWGTGTPLAKTGSVVRANASSLATSRVFGCISGALKAGSGSNLYYIIRRAGNIGSDDLLGHFWIAPFDTPGWSYGTYYLGTTDGSVTTTAPTSPNIANRIIEAYDGGIEIIPGSISPIGWDAINDKPAAYPPSGS